MLAKSRQKNENDCPNQTSNKLNAKSHLPVGHLLINPSVYDHKNWLKEPEKTKNKITNVCFE